MTATTPNYRVAFRIVVRDKVRNFKFGTDVKHNVSRQMNDKLRDVTHGNIGVTILKTPFWAVFGVKIEGTETFFIFYTSRNAVTQN